MSGRVEQPAEPGVLVLVLVLAPAGHLRRTRWRGKRRTQLAAYMVAAAYNLLRIAKFRAQCA